MSSALELSGVSKRFLDFHLDSLSFSLPQGYIMGLVGPNGAGKTTTVQLILGMLKRDAGQIRALGLDPAEHGVQIKEDVGVVFDSLMFVNGWTVNDTERVISRFYLHWNKKTFASLVEQFELPRKKNIGDFSRGMQMKLMLACALSHDAKLLILDEPTSGLDAVTRDLLSEILQDYIKDGERSVLLSTHISSDLERIADYITFIRDGKLFYTGSLEDLMESYCLIKGSPEQAAPLRSKILGLRATNIGFEGLIKREEAPSFGDLLVDKPTLDDIVVFASKKEVKN
jgi:ABC-2 type transport system ATP-binding protein